MKVNNAIIKDIEFYVVETKCKNKFCSGYLELRIKQDITPIQSAWIKSHKEYIKDIVITQWFFNEMKQYEYLWSNGDWVAVNYENYLCEDKV